MDSLGGRKGHIEREACHMSMDEQTFPDDESDKQVRFSLVECWDRIVMVLQESFPWQNIVHDESLSGWEEGHCKRRLLQGDSDVHFSLQWRKSSSKYSSL